MCYNDHASAPPSPGNHYTYPRSTSLDQYTDNQIPNMTTSPSITVKITASSPVFDLSRATPFTITLALCNQHTTSITFLKWYAGLFDGKLLWEGGLVFTNVITNKRVSRATIDICRFGSNSDGIPISATASEYVTLFPGEEHIIKTTFTPKQGKAGDGTETVENGPLPPGMAWFGVAGFEDSNVYEVGVSEEAVVKEWFEGSIEEVVKQRELGRKVERREDKIRYTVIEPCTFELKRPDADGSLDCWFDRLGSV
jgi:hypothetical protein